VRHFVATLLLLGLAAMPAAAQDNDSHGRVYDLEPGVMLQRATEAGAEEAVVNLPFLPGDRVWTDASGRADFQFPDGTRLRLDNRSKIDYAAHDEGRDERISLRLWSGGMYLHVRGGRDRADYEIETPNGLIETQGEGVYRLDVDSGETRLTVYEGEATLDSGHRRVTVGAGMRSYARRGESPERPRAFDAEENDEFASWDQEREERETRTASSRRYLPEELDAYAPEFERNGTWYNETEVGYVWRPQVAVGWRPYTNGRWVWTAYGWTWVPGERWGWAASHYGRWGHSGGLGWYWIPGNTWGPAWVSWATGGGYVGWCPLGRYDRPVYQPRQYGYAGARGSVGSGWSFVRREEMSARDVARRRVETVPEGVVNVRIAESARVRPTRDLRELTEVNLAVPRAVRVKPTPGDSVLELQRDNQTQVGVGPLTPSGRRRNGSARNDEAAGDGRDRAVARPSDPRPETARPEPRHPTDVRSPGRSERVVSEPGGAAAREGRPPSTNRDTDRGRDRGGESDREVLRPIFRPLSEPGKAQGGDNSRTRDEDRARPWSGGVAPPDQTRTPPREDGYSRPRESSPPPRSEPRTASPRSEPRSEPREQAPRSEPRSQAPRSEPRSSSPPPRASAPPPHASAPPANSGGGAVARPRKERE